MEYEYLNLWTKRMPIAKIIHYTFVILHYGDATVTMKAIDSIRALDRCGHKVSVIVVDNASPNETGELVKKQIESLPDFYYIHNEKNLGFARGNTVGFLFAKNELKADFIILMNNDAVIESSDFCEQVVMEYEKEKFAVLGPCIYTPAGVYQNPLRRALLKGLRLKMTIAYLWLDLLLTTIYVSPIAIKMLGRFLPKKKLASEPLDNVELHGSFLVFSPQYIEKFDGLDARTFMYCEEEFLFARCQYNGLKVIYLPSIKVRHNESEYISESALKMRRRRLFRIKNCLKSLRIYAQTNWDAST